MQTAPDTIVTFLQPFAKVFGRRVFQHASLLFIGTLLCQQQRTMTQVLRTLGLGQLKNFGKFHRLLNRGKWSSPQLARLLLQLLLKTFSPRRLVIAVDATLERRRGKHVYGLGCYRDAVRSSKGYTVKSFGLAWNCMALLLTVPFTTRLWALPFLTVLMPSKKANEAKGKPHRTCIDWTMVMCRLVRRWLKNQVWVLVADGAYAAIHFVRYCQKNQIQLVSRLRLDASLYDFPPEKKPATKGRKRLKGQRLPRLKTLATDPNTVWQEATIRWYNGVTKKIQYLSGVALWYKPGEAPVTIRWVLTKIPEHPDKVEAFFGSDTQLSATDIVELFVMRWNIEVTFEDSRRHLGIETQRQWSQKAVGRTTPLLFGLFSLVCVRSLQLSKKRPLQAANTSWYQKNQQTLAFSDLLAAVRREILSQLYFSESTVEGDYIKINKLQWEKALNQMALVA